MGHLLAEDEDSDDDAMKTSRMQKLGNMHNSYAHSTTEKFLKFIIFFNLYKCDMDLWLLDVFIY